MDRIRSCSRASLLALLSLPLAAACTGSGPPAAPDGSVGPMVSLVDVPPFVSHEVTVHVVAHDPSGIARVELYLDDQRVSQVELAPFDARWDASGFAEGPHELRAVAYSSDGRSGSARVPVTIDRTPPEVELASAAAADQPYGMVVSDDHELVDVVVTHDDDPAVHLTAAPFAYVWPAGCNPRAHVIVVATDAAGNQGQASGYVDARDAQDADCDGFRAVAAGGLDCDDGDPAISPAAADDGSSLADRNCDGVPGVDADHDGVPALASGGSDCDDAAPATHGGWALWRGSAFDAAFGGGSAPSSYSLATDGTSVDVAFATTAGTLYLAEGDIDAQARATFAPPTAVTADLPMNDSGISVRLVTAPAGPTIGLVAGGAVRVATRQGSAWTIATVEAPADGASAGEADLAVDHEGHRHMIYVHFGASDMELRYATDRGGTWTGTTVARVTTVPRPVIAIDSMDRPCILYQGDHVLYAFTLDAGAWQGSAIDFGASDYGYALSSQSSPGDVEAVVAAYRSDTGTQLSRGFQSQGFSLNGPIEHLSAYVGPLAIQGNDLVYERYFTGTGRDEVVASHLGLGFVSQILGQGYVLGISSGTPPAVLFQPQGAKAVLAISAGTIAPAEDPPGGADQDCDGND